jgi:hypothetical protein
MSTSNIQHPQVSRGVAVRACLSIRLGQFTDCTLTHGKSKDSFQFICRPSSFSRLSGGGCPTPSHIPCHSGLRWSALCAVPPFEIRDPPSCDPRPASPVCAGLVAGRQRERVLGVDRRETHKQQFFSFSRRPTSRSSFLTGTPMPRDSSGMAGNGDLDQNLAGQSDENRVHSG